MNAEKIIKRQRKGFLISVISILGLQIVYFIIVKNIYWKLIFIIMAMGTTILSIYYNNKLNLENDITRYTEIYGDYDKFEHRYFSIFVPYFITLTIINMIIIFLTHANLYITIILFLIIMISSFFIYNKYVRQKIKL